MQFVDLICNIDGGLKSGGRSGAVHTGLQSCIHKRSSGFNGEGAMFSIWGEIAKGMKRQLNPFLKFSA